MDVLKRNVLALGVAGVAFISIGAVADQGWAYTYTASGLIETSDGPRTDVNDITSYTYDAQGNIATVTNAMGHFVSISAYDAFDLPTTLINSNGIETQLVYDTQHRLISSTVVHPSTPIFNVVTLYTYDAVGQVIQIQFPNGEALHYEYDDAYRLVAVENGLGERIEYTVDAAGNRTSEVIKGVGGVIQKTLTRTYDELSRLLENVGASGQQDTRAYDVNGNSTEETDGRLNTTTNTFDALNRLVTSTDPNVNAVHYDYDANDRLVSVTDQRGLVTSYTYDVYDNLLSITSPDTELAVYTYDNAGNRLSETDARGVVTQYTYDALNRLQSVSYPGSAIHDVTYDYDDTTSGNRGVGRLTGIADELGFTFYKYNYLGHMVEKRIDLNDKTYNRFYQYDLSGLLLSTRYPSGRIVRYLRDDAGRITSVYTQSWEGAVERNVAKNLSYLPFGGLKSFEQGNGIVSTLNYDQDYRVSSIDTSGALSLLNRDYSFDLSNNIDGITDLVDASYSQLFAYDALSRLDSADGNYGDQSYNYDAVGNRLSLDVVQGGTTQTDTYSYGLSNNRLQTLDLSPEQIQYTFTYDESGNLVDDPRSNQTLTYSDPNRLVGVSNSGSTSSFRQNSLGQRIEKTVTTNGTPSTTFFHYDESGNLIAETNDLGSVIREYLYVGSVRVAVLAPGANADTDNDGLDDDWESQFFGDLAQTGTGDPDGDSFSNLTEYIAGTLPDEVASYPGATIDSDGDGMRDSWELINFNSLDRSGVEDYDGDGVSDWQEYVSDSSPAVITDVDADNLPDEWENHYFGDLQQSGVDDYDSDGLSNLVEFQQGSNPIVSETPGITIIVDNVDSGFSFTGSWLEQTEGTDHEGSSHLLFTQGSADDLGVVTVDNLDEGTTSTGSWTSLTLSTAYHEGSNAVYHASGSGLNVFEWLMPTTTELAYKVYAKWVSHSNRGSNVPYTVHHAGGATTVLVNQQVDGGVWNLLGEFTLDANSKVVVSDDANGYVLADAIRLTSAGADVIVDNSDLDTTVTGSWVNSSVSGGPYYYGNNVVYHAPGAGLNSFEWQLPAIDSLSYVVYAQWWQHANRGSNVPYTIQATGETTTIRVNQQGNGASWQPLGEFSLDNTSMFKISDDANGYVIADALRLIQVDTGLNRALWQPSIQTQAEYHVYAKWSAGADRSTTALYTIKHVNGQSKVRVDQTANGGVWGYLGQFTLDAVSEVNLSGNANGSVAADAIKFESVAGAF